MKKYNAKKPAPKKEETFSMVVLKNPKDGQQNMLLNIPLSIKRSKIRRIVTDLACVSFGLKELIVQFTYYS